jgi:hypothetical protein
VASGDLRPSQRIRVCNGVVDAGTGVDSARSHQGLRRRNRDGPAVGLAVVSPLPRCPMVVSADGFPLDGTAVLLVLEQVKYEALRYAIVWARLCAGQSDLDTRLAGYGLVERALADELLGGHVLRVLPVLRRHALRGLESLAEYTFARADSQVMQDGCPRFLAWASQTLSRTARVEPAGPANLVKTRLAGSSRIASELPVIHQPGCGEFCSSECLDDFCRLRNG